MGSLVTHTIGSHIFYHIVSSESRLMEPCRTPQMLHLVSGPQGSVLGPMLFLLYINYINENIQSSIRLFAADSIIYRKINSTIDHQILQTEIIQHYAARFVANDHRLTTSPTTLVLTLNWQTIERRRTIKQAMTLYTILNNMIEINPPTGLLTRSHNRHLFTIPRSRLNTVV